MLKKNEIVNIVHGNMEFGPRALCNTTTLALPTTENVEFINTINHRNTVMPMAPVMLERNKEYFFDKIQTERVVGSDRYMILTYDYKDEVVKNEYTKYSGIMHKYPLKDLYSGRPQFIMEYEEELLIYQVLNLIEKDLGYKALINTSFNFHGKPILFSLDQVADDVEDELKNLKKPEDASRMITLIGNY